MEYDLLKNDLLWVIPREDLLCLKDFRFDFFRAVNTKGATHLKGFKNIYRSLDIAGPRSDSGYDHSKFLAENGYVVVLLSGMDHKIDKPIVLGVFRPAEISEKQTKFLDDITPFLNQEYDTSLCQTMICEENNVHKKR